MAEDVYEDLPVTLRKTAQGDHYEAGVVADGVFVSLGAIKVGEFDARVAEAEAAAAAEKKSGAKK
jgi:hypothetical protein